MMKKSHWLKPPYVIACHWLLAKSYCAMALYPFIILKNARLRHDQRLMLHERIHLRQQIELLIVPFYVLYLAHYLYLLCRLRNHQQAYRNICFEKEAYAHEHNPDYLKQRPLWAWRHCWHR
jgi:hypothetical protein